MSSAPAREEICRCERAGPDRPPQAFGDRGHGRGGVVGSDAAAVALTPPRLLRHPVASRCLGHGWRLVVAVVVCVLPGCGSRRKSVRPRSVVSHATPSAGPRIPAPRGVAYTDDGGMVCVDTAGRILTLGPSGKVRRQWTMPETEVGSPEDLTVLANGDIAVPDTHYHRVVIFSREGVVRRTFGDHGQGPGQFIYPVALTEDPSGDLYVCEYGSNDRVQKFSSEGEPLGSFGSFGTGPGQFQRPAGIVWYDGRIYVADAVNHRIQIFSDAGEHLGVLGAREAGTVLRFPYDIAIDRSGRLHVVEWGAGRLSVLDLSGRLLGSWTGADKGGGRLRTPWGVACGDEGRILVADTGNRRLVELRL